MIVTRLRIASSLLTLLSVAAFGTQGCVFDGDASLGNDGTAGSAGSPGSAGSKSNAGGATSNAGTSSAGAGKPSGAGTGTSSSGGSGSAGEPSHAGSAPEAGSPTGAAGEPGAGGAGSDVCQLEIVTGPCDAAIFHFAYDAKADNCVPFTYGGCEGNANNFETIKACHEQCQNVSCPSELQTDTVYVVSPLNRPEGACVVLDDPMKISCSMLLDPSLTAPHDWPQNRCVKKSGRNQLYYAGTTLPRADGWEDCSAPEAQSVNNAPDCASLK